MDFTDPPSKGERLSEVWRRLHETGPFSTANEALARFCEILNAVEDEVSGISKDLAAAKAGNTGGRMYPPDEMFRVGRDHPLITSYRQTGHITRFGKNGSIEVAKKFGDVEFYLAGTDGRTVSDLLQEKTSESP